MLNLTDVHFLVRPHRLALVDTFWKVSLSTPFGRLRRRQLLEVFVVGTFEVIVNQNDIKMLLVILILIIMVLIIIKKAPKSHIFKSHGPQKSMF